MLTVEDMLLAAAGGAEPTENYLFTWGSNAFQQLGAGAPPVGGFYDLSWKQISLANHVLAIRSDDTLWVWGDNSPGVLGTGNTLAYASPFQLGTSSWIAVAAGLNHSLAIRQGGTLFAWGGNAQGELGNGTNIARSSPFQIGTSSWSVVSAGRSFSAAIRQGGTLFTWGVNSVGQLGDQNTVSAPRSSPFQIGTSSWTSVSAGEQHIAAIRQGGTLFAWGFGLQGALGYNNLSPDQWYLPITSWTAVSIGLSGGVGIKDGGRLFTWGYNGGGRLGNNRTFNDISSTLSPIQISTSSWIAVATGPSHALAIRQGGTLFAWGGNAFGELGDGTNISRSSPYQIGTSSWSVLPSANMYFRRSAAIRQGGTLFLWGNQLDGSLGDGTADSDVNRSSPVQIGSSSWSVVSVSNQYTTLAIRSDGTLWSWGRNQYGGLGYPQDQYSQSFTVIYGTQNEFTNLGLGGNLYTTFFPDLGSTVPPNDYGTSWSAVAFGNMPNNPTIAGHVLAIRNGLLYTWGNNRYGQLGDGTTSNTERSSPVQIGTSSWIAVAASFGSSWAIRQDGRLFAWGYGGINADGYFQGTTLGLDDLSLSNRSSPTQIGTSSWAQVSAGNNHVIARRVGGTIFTWGNNQYGQLGLANSAGAVPVITESWSAVVANRNNGGFGLKNDFAWWWGYGQYVGQTSSLDETSSPNLLGTSWTVLSWRQVSVGTFGGAVGVSSNGTLYTWGTLQNGTGGDGRNSFSTSSPIQLGTSSWTAVSASGNHILALRQGGTLFAWGLNSSGQLGDGTNIARSSPYQIGTSSWSLVRGGLNSSGAIRQGGTLFMWGVNSAGQLGDGTTFDRSSPYQIGTSSWTQLSQTEVHTLAIRQGGTLFAWGENTHGSLGIGNNEGRSSPFQVGTSSWTAVSAWYYASAAIRQGGTLFVWGWNGQAQLGQGDFTSRNSPVQIGAPVSTLSWTAVDVGYYNMVASSVPSTTYPSGLWAWGYGFNPVGVGQYSTITSPVLASAGGLFLSPYQVGTSSWQFVAAGSSVSSAIRQGGTIFSWGRNYQGALGDGSTGENRSSPYQVGTSSWTAVGWPSSINQAMIRQDGTLWGTGSRTNGQLGDQPFTTFDGRSQPYQIGTANNHSMIMTAGWSSVDGTIAALRNDGTIWSTGNKPGWDNNNTGEFYRSSPTLAKIPVSNASPKQIGTDTDWYTVSGGGEFAPWGMAVKNNGQIWGWGSNNFGQLGDSSTIDRSSPVQAYSSLNNQPYTMSAGIYHWLATTFWASTIRFTYVCGYNNQGQLGTGNTIGRSTPTTLSFPPNFTNAFASGYQSNAVNSTNDSYNVGWYRWGDAAGQDTDGTSPYWRSEPLFLGFANFNSPVQVGFGSWISVSAGVNNTVALRQGGSLWAWGRTQFGMLGNNNSVYPGVSYGFVNSSVSVLAAGTWTDITVNGVQTAQALRNDGTLWYWGLGPNAAATSFQYRSSPQQITGSVSWAALSATRFNLNARNLARATTGLVYQFGALAVANWSAQGYPERSAVSPVQLGLNMNISPVQIGAEKNWLAVSVGSSHVLAIKSNKSLWAWGTNNTGQMGDGTTINSSSPVPVGSDSWLKISAGISSSIGIKTDGTLWAWGLNSSGQLGDGTIISRSSPVPVGTSSWTAISAGVNIAGAIRQGGTLFTWGQASFGSLGDGTNIARSSPVQIGTSSWTAVETGTQFGMAIRADGTLWAWGSSFTGQNGDPLSTYRSSPVQIGTSSWLAISAGSTLAMAVDTQYKLWAWGNNSAGQTGLARATPPTYTIWQGAQGGDGAFTLDDQGRIYSVGTNTDGQLGQNLPGGTLGVGYASRIGTSSWTALSAGYRNAFAIRQGGTLFGWGQNVFGVLGNGTTIARSSPVQIGTSSWTSVSAYQYYNTMAIRQGGTLFVWGDNSSGQVGDDTTINRSSPYQIGTSSWAVVARGQSGQPGHSLAIRQGGTLFAWGNNFYGQLGDGTNIARSSPYQIGTSSWIAVTTGSFVSLAIRSDGSLWGMGWNANGDIGDGTTLRRSSPVLISSSSWTSVLSNGGTTFALRQDGTYWAWGGSNFTNYPIPLVGTNRSSPVQITGGPSSTSWSQIGLWGGVSGGKVYSWYISRMWANGLITQSNGSSVIEVWLDSFTNSFVRSPVQIGTSSWIAVRADALGLTASAQSPDFKVWTWGNTFYNSLGNFPLPQVERSSPVQIGGSNLFLDWDVGWGGSAGVTKLPE